MHYMRVHSKKILVPKQAERLGRPASGVNGEENAEPVKLGRPRKAAVTVQVNYCPQCGCNLTQVALGMAVAAHQR